MGFPKYFIKHFEDIKNSLIFVSIKRTFKKTLPSQSHFHLYINALTHHKDKTQLFYLQSLLHKNKKLDIPLHLFYKLQ